MIHIRYLCTCQQASVTKKGVSFHSSQLVGRNLAFLQLNKLMNVPSGLIAILNRANSSWLLQKCQSPTIAQSARASLIFKQAKLQHIMTSDQVILGSTMQLVKSSPQYKVLGILLLLKMACSTIRYHAYVLQEFVSQIFSTDGTGQTIL